MSPAARSTIAVAILMAVWWLTEAVDLAVTALLPALLFPIFSVADIRTAAQPYGHEYIFLFAGGFLLAISMQRWGLDRRIALLTLRIVGSQPRRIIAGVMLASAVMAAFVSNTAVAAMMLPIALSLSNMIRRDLDVESTSDQDGRNFTTAILLAVAYSASIGGVCTIIGTPPNTLMVAFATDDLPIEYRCEIGFVQWMLIGVPAAAIMLPVAWLLLTRVIFPIRMNEIPGGAGAIRKALVGLGPMNRGELITMMAFGMAVLAWMSRPWLTNWTVDIGGEAFQPLKGLTDTGIVLFAALLLFVMPVGGGKGPILRWSDSKNLPWGVLVLFGGGLSLSAAMDANGVTEFLGSFATAIHGAPTLLVTAIILIGVVFLSEVASNTALAATSIPVLAAMAPAMGVHPLQLIVPATFGCSLAFMLPAGTPPNAIVFGTGHISMRSMVKAGFLLNLIGIVVVMLMTWLLIPAWIDQVSPSSHTATAVPQAVTMSMPDCAPSTS